MLQSEIKFKPLEWSDAQPPNNTIHYNHVTAQTPLGRFLITWKGWKTFDCPTIEETPWGGVNGVERTQIWKTLSKLPKSTTRKSSIITRTQLRRITNADYTQH